MRVLFFLATLVCFTAVAPVGSTAKVKIKTSAICGMCKDAIESALLELPGVKSADPKPYPVNTIAATPDGPLAVRGRFVSGLSVTLITENTLVKG